MTKILFILFLLIQPVYSYGEKFTEEFCKQNRIQDLRKKVGAYNIATEINETRVKA